MIGGSVDTIEYNEYCTFKNDIIAMVNENRPFDATNFHQLTLEKLRFTPDSGPDVGKSRLWWLTWAVQQGHFEAFEMIWLQHNQDLVLDDFRSRQACLPSPLIFLADAAKKLPRPFNWVWQRWEKSILVNDLQTKVTDGPLKNTTMMNGMIIAASVNKIKRDIIEKLLATIPLIFSREDLSNKPLHDLSIEDFFAQIIAQNSDWGVKIKRMIDARNAFFEGIANLTAQANVNDFSKIELLAQEADKEGYIHALADVDTLVAMIHSAQKNEWALVIRLLENNRTNAGVFNENLHNILAKIAKKQTNWLAVNQVNRCFGKNKQFNEDDFSEESEVLKRYEARFKPAASFVSHALIKKGSVGNPYTAHQYTFANPLKTVPNIVTLQSIQCFSNNGTVMYEATTDTNQKMVSTEYFSVEVQTFIEATFVTESYDLVFFVPKNDKGYEQGLYSYELITPFKIDAPKISCDSVDEDCPVVRENTRNIEIDDIHMRQYYHHQPKLNERDQEAITKSLKGKALDLYKAFCHFYSAFFTDRMVQVTKKSYDGNNHYAPEVLHAIAKQFHRPSERHNDVKNLAIAPKWLNSLMMIIESAIRWHAIHSPFGTFSLKTVFKTFPLSHVLREGKMEGTLKWDEREVKISKELQPYQKFPTFPRITDITQATYVLNCLLHGKASQPIPILAVGEASRTLLNQFSAPIESVTQSNTMPAESLPKERIRV
jgi:hypothetical protein